MGSDTTIVFDDIGAADYLAYVLTKNKNLVKLSTSAFKIAGTVSSAAAMTSSYAGDSVLTLAGAGIFNNA